MSFRHEDGKEGRQLFSESKVICGTCVSQVIQILYAAATAPIVNPSTTNVRLINTAGSRLSSGGNFDKFFKIFLY